jgi:hypothetical protein
MGVQSLYEERGNPFLTLRVVACWMAWRFPCNEAMQRLQSGIAEQLIPVNYYVTATRNGQTVFSGFAGSGYARPEDMLMSQMTTHGSLTPAQTQQFGSQLGNQSFWLGLLNGSTDFGTSYADTTYSDDVGPHDISSAYNVNIFGGAGMIGQNTLPLPTDLKAKVTNIINNPKYDCANYIKQLLGAVKGKIESDDAVKLYGRVDREGGFSLKRLQRDHAGEADFKGNKRIIYVNPISTPATAREILHSEYVYANTVLNELMHHARKNGTFSDRALARAAFSLLSADEKLKHPLPTTSDIEINSRYFHPLFNTHCRSITGE